MIRVLLGIGVSNALLATLLAAIALLITRRMRPQFALAIWLLVLVKLLMPPLWTAPLGPLSTWMSAEAPREPVTWTIDEPIDFEFPLPASPLPPVSREIALASDPPARATSFEVSFPLVLFSIWLFGSMLWTATALSRMRRFSKVLAQTRLAPIAIQTEVEVLSRQCGLRRAPHVRVTRRRTAPLVWAFGRRATILLPAELLTQLSRDELRALLLHELAHVRRRDHLTKLVEMAAVAIYWWLPTAWCARRQVDCATERCCDAEVVAQLFSTPGSYATALVKTLDFLSHPTEPLPLRASGFSQFRHVSRRIEMILQPAPVSRALWRHRLALVSLCAIVLPVSVSSLWAESAEDAQATEECAPDQHHPSTSAFPPDLESLWKFRASGLFSRENLERAKAERAKLEAAGDAHIHMRAKHCNALRKQWDSLTAAYKAQEVGIEELLSTQRKLVDAEMTLTADLCPKTPVGRELRSLCHYVTIAEALASAKETYWLAYQRREQAGMTTADDQRAKEQFQYFRDVYARLINDVYSTPAFESDPQTLQFMLGALDREGLSATDRKVYSVRGNPTRSQTRQFDPPSDDEVLIVFRGRCAEERRPLPARHIRIKKHRIAEYDDPPVKDYPVIGQARNSHALYRCTVDYQDADGQDHRDVIYVDHHHLRQTSASPARDDAEADKSAMAPSDGKFVRSAEQGNAWQSFAEVQTGEPALASRIEMLVKSAVLDSTLLETHAARRDAAVQQLAAMESAFDTRTVTIDQLLEAQRRHTEAQLSFYNQILPPDSDDKRLLLHQAHLMVIGDSLDAARRTWQKVYAKYRIGAEGGEPAAEAQAREQFYQFKSEFERVQTKYEQELRRTGAIPRQSSSQSAPSVADANDPLRAEMNRVSIVGPVTTGDDVTPLDPPSDEDVLRALAIKVSGERRSLRGEPRRIVKERISTYTDPPKWHPRLFGKGQLHHAHYKCTVEFAGPQGEPHQEVVYVDQNHLHQKVDRRSFEEFQSGPIHYAFASGATKEIVQFRHFQMQLAREKAKLADLQEQLPGESSAEQQAERRRLELNIAKRQQALDAAVRTVLHNALTPARTTPRE